MSELRDYDDISTNKYISNKRTIPHTTETEARTFCSLFFCLRDENTIEQDGKKGKNANSFVSATCRYDDYNQYT